MTKIALLCSLLLLSTACIKTADQVQREQRFENMSEQMKDSQGLVGDMVNQMKDMQKQLDKMNGRMEELEHKQGKVNPENLNKMAETVTLLKTQSEAQNTQLLQIQNELKEQRTFIEKVTASLENMGKPSKASKKKSDKSELQEALDLVKANQYDDARSALEGLMNDDSLSPGDKNKVLHGLGRVEFFTKNYDKALVYFSKIFSKFPKASLAPSSLLFIGKSLKSMGKKDEATEAFTKLTEDYPDSKEAKDAKKEL